MGPGQETLLGGVRNFLNGDLRRYLGTAGQGDIGQGVYLTEVDPNRVGVETIGLDTFDELPIADDQIDFGFLNGNVLFADKNLAVIVTELRRVLKEGGRLIAPFNYDAAVRDFFPPKLDPHFVEVYGESQGLLVFNKE
jgi:SAM-dependent methyltransferase